MTDLLKLLRELQEKINNLSHQDYKYWSAFSSSACLGEMDICTLKDGFGKTAVFCSWPAMDPY